MTLYMLDTNAASAALRGNPNLDLRLAGLGRGDWCISAVTRAELSYGLALKPQAASLALLVAAFLAVARTEPWDAAAADRHGELRARLRRLGTPIGDFDETIAAHALALGAVLVTDNEQHFRRVEGLAIENWLRAG
jgi:tRNA(fMet)-specific endonuclease VapC